MRVPPDFVEFLKLLHEKKVRYLLVGGYAVNLHGYSRRTDDLDVWIEISEPNAARLAEALVAFGYSPKSVPPDLFLARNRITRMGVAPLRLEILSDIAGVTFADCYERRIVAKLGGVPVDVIDQERLLENKRAAGRPKDLADVDAFEARRQADSVRRNSPKRPRKRR